MILKFVCGFRALAGLLADEAALKRRHSFFGSGRDASEKHGKRYGTAGALLLLLTFVCGVSRADEPLYDIDIPSMNAAEALNRFAEQTGAITLFPYDLASTRDANAVRGRYTLLQGLDLLLRGTGLSGGLSNKRVVSISQLEKQQRPGEERVMPKQNVSLKEKIAAFVASMFSAAAASSQNADIGAYALEEIVVTAQKRSERLQDVPVPVTALDAGTLAESGQLRLQDYFARVPGLSFQAGGRNGEPQVSMRGINSTQNPTVGVTVDDVPYGSSVFRGGGFIAPDIDPSDLSRIEILRGPQGTLYGANSIGGLIKYVTVEPSTDRLSGDVATSVTQVSDGDAGYGVRAAVNVPLGDSIAVRASGFTREEPGYIDNLQTGERDINDGDAAGGMLSALYRPSEKFSLKLNALMQERSTDGASLANPALGDLRQRTLAGTGWTERKLEAYSATITSAIGDAQLTSLTGYNTTEFGDSVDVSSVFAPFANLYFGVGGAPYVEQFDARKFSQELRVVAPIGERLELLLGGFYTREKFTFATHELAANAATGAVVGTMTLYDGRGGYEEYAAFADLTVRFTDRFDVQFGGRSAHNRQYYSEVDTGPRAPGGGLVIPRSQIEDEPVTYLVTPRFKVSPDFMIYARFASGYRAGGINLAAARGYPVPAGYDSDTTYNYEIGIKGDAFGGALSVDASAFYIDWKDLQVSFNYAPGINFQNNASRAKSQGIELSLTARPWSGATVAASAVYDEAELTESFGASTTRGLPGDRLPFTSKLAGALSVDQRIELSANWSSFFGASVAYVGDRVGLFRTTPIRQTYPSYAQVDARAGIEFQSWRLALFGTNLTDRRGLVGGGLGQTIPTMFNYIQPRTIGLSLSATF